MKTEYEAAFTDVDIVQLREKMTRIGAENKRPDFLQKRVTLNLPINKRSPDTWLRVRDEGNKITLALKGITGNTIEDQKELETVVDDFRTTIDLLVAIGCEIKSFQESRRELWVIDDTEITIDTWPFLEPYVEVEGESEEQVKTVSEKLGFDFADAKFCSTSEIYKMKYGITLEELPKSVLDNFSFSIENPFLS